MQLTGDCAAALARAETPAYDYPIILRGSKGPFPDREPAQLYSRACEQGWPDACGMK